MSDKIEELLTVLDMSEKKQRHWLIKKHFWLGDSTNSLADLAFQLRDEVAEIWKQSPGYWIWGKALQDVYCAATKKKWDGIEFIRWFVYNAQPIHWIVAALIAKELVKENKNE